MSGVTNSPRIAARRAATTAEITAAAWALAREQGLAELSLRPLAERVGMRAQSLYSYFASKHALYDAMFREGNEALLALQTRLDAEAAGLDLRETTRRNIRAFFAFSTDDPVRFQLLFQRTIPGFEPSPESYDVARRAYDAGVAHLRRAGIDEETIDLWIAVVTGLASQQIANDPGGDRWIRLVDRTVDVLFAAIDATTEPSATTETTASPTAGRRGPKTRGART